MCVKTSGASALLAAKALYGELSSSRRLVRKIQPCDPVSTCCNRLCRWQRSDFSMYSSSVLRSAKQLGGANCLLMSMQAATSTFSQVLILLHRQSSVRSTISLAYHQYTSTLSHSNCACAFQPCSSYVQVPGLHSTACQASSSNADPQDLGNSKLFYVVAGAPQHDRQPHPETAKRVPAIMAALERTGVTSSVHGDKVQQY